MHRTRRAAHVASADDDFTAPDAAAWLDEYVADELPELGSHQVLPGGMVYLVGAGPGDPGLLTVRRDALVARGSEL